MWWRGVPDGSAAAVQSLARGRTVPVVPAPVRYGVPPVRYQYGYRYGVPRVGYGAPVHGGTAVQYGTPVRHGAPRGGVPVKYGMPVRRVTARPAPGRAYRRQRRLPAGLSIAWVPVPAWNGSQPPPGSYRY
jgi:hypothetical protein